MLPPRIPIKRILPIVITEIEPFSYLDDLVRLMRSSRLYFNPEIMFKASLYKYWVSEWEHVMMDQAIDRFLAMQEESSDSESGSIDVFSPFWY